MAVQMRILLGFMGKVTFSMHRVLYKVSVFLFLGGALWKSLKTWFLSLFYNDQCLHVKSCVKYCNNCYGYTESYVDQRYSSSLSTWRYYGNIKAQCVWNKNRTRTWNIRLDQSTIWIDVGWIFLWIRFDDALRWIHNKVFRRSKYNKHWVIAFKHSHVFIFVHFIYTYVWVSFHGDWVNDRFKFSDFI